MATQPPDVRLAPTSGTDDVTSWAGLFNSAMSGRPLRPEYLARRWEWAGAYSVLARRDGRVVGAASVETPGWTPSATYAPALLTVGRDERGQGVGSMLLGALSDWARDNGFDGLDVWVEEADADGLAFLDRRGYREVEREHNSRVELDSPVPPVVLPHEVVFVSLAQRDDLDEALHAVASDAFPDIPSAEPVAAGDFAHWRAGDLRLPGLIEECSVVALAVGRVVGYALLVDRDPRPGVAYNEMTAVVRDQRGRGIGSAMKRDVMRRAQRSGLVAIETSNEVRNSPMLAVNRALGYAPLGDSIKLRGPLR